MLYNMLYIFCAHWLLQPKKMCMVLWWLVETFRILLIYSFISKSKNTVWVTSAKLFLHFFKAEESNCILQWFLPPPELLWQAECVCVRGAAGAGVQQEKVTSDCAGLLTPLLPRVDDVTYFSFITAYLVIMLLGVVENIIIIVSCYRNKVTGIIGL